MDKWAEKLIDEHKNPVVKLNFTRKKLFQHGTTGESNCSKEYLQILKNSIDTNRVERRCARSKLIWLHDKHMASGKNLVGSIVSTYGYQDKSGKFFYPEEALYLLETNKVEIFWNDVPMSIQQAYKVIINDEKCDLNTYRAYKKLRLQGYKVTRAGNSKKDYGPIKKKIKRNESEVLEDHNEEVNATKNMFERLQSRGPQENANNFENVSRFFIYKKEKKDIPDYKVQFLKSSFNTDIGFHSEEIPNVYCFAEKDSISYLRCCQINIPNLF